MRPGERAGEYRCPLPLWLYGDLVTLVVTVASSCYCVQRVRADEGKALAEEFNVPFFETSAKENINVKEAVFSLAKLVKERILTADGTEEVYKIDTIRLTREAAKPEGSKCSC
jgi:Ras-related protein Rab-8A